MKVYNPRLVLAILSVILGGTECAMAGTAPISVASDGTALGRGARPVVSRNDRFVAYQGYSAPYSSIFVHDLLTGKTREVSAAPDGSRPNADSSLQWISADGRYIAYESLASNLVPGDNNGGADAFLYDGATGKNIRLIVPPTGPGGPVSTHIGGITADGRTILLSAGSSGNPPADSGVNGMYFFDVATGTLSRVGKKPDGSWIVGYEPGFSADGKYIVFVSSDSDIVPNDTNNEGDVFRLEVATGTVQLASVSSTGVQANQECDGWNSITGDGRYVPFFSQSTNLFPATYPGWGYIFVHDFQTGETLCPTVDADGLPTALDESYPTMSDDGHWFACDADFGGGRTSYPASCLRNMDTGELTTIYYSTGTSVSADGHYWTHSNPSGVLVLDSLTDLPLADAVWLGDHPLSPAGVQSGTACVGGGDGVLHIDKTNPLQPSAQPVDLNALLGTQVRLLGRPAIYGYDDAADGSPGVYLCTDLGHVVRLGLDGSVKWIVRPDASAAGNDSAPAVTSDGTVYVGIAGASGCRVYGMSATDGKGVLASPAITGPSGTITSLAVINGRIYAGVTQGLAGDLVTLDANSLAPLGVNISSGEGVAAAPYVEGEEIFAGTQTGGVYKLNAATMTLDPGFDPAGGAGRAEIGENITGLFGDDAGTVYAGTALGKVFALNTATGAGKQTAFFNSDVPQPVAGPVMTLDRRTVAFGVGSTFYEIPAGGGTPATYPASGNLLSTPAYDSVSNAFVAGSDTGSLYTFPAM